MTSQSVKLVAHDLILGVDGGGTKTAACLCRRDTQGLVQPIGRGRGGGSNLVASGLTVATDSLQEAILSAFADAGLAFIRVGRATLGLAGCGDPTNAQLIREWCAAHHIAAEVSVFSDVEAILRSATPHGWGAAVVAGTGSSVLGVDPEGRIARAGGYGYILGDEGSGFWIGREAIRAVLRALEGCGPETALTPRLTRHLGVSRRVAIAAHIHRSDNVRQAVADCARLVPSAADDGDPVAVGILEQAGKRLAQQVLSVTGQLEFQDRHYHLALVGSVLVDVPAVSAEVERELAANQRSPERMIMVDDPALTMAQR